MSEEWKTLTILGLDYEVSNTGKVKGLGRNKELKQRYTNDGYLEVTVGKEYEGRTSRRVHTLVALAFIPKPNNYEIFEINHKDLNRENNNVDNLEWVTHQENIDYSVNLGRYKGKFGESNPNYGSNTLKKKFKENPELRKTQSRPREQNGRCIKVKMIDTNTMKEYHFNFMGECAEFLKENYEIKSTIDSLRVTIKARINDKELYRKRFRFLEE